MSALPTVGRYVYAIPMLVFGVMHFMRADGMAGMVPIPGGVIWVYITGIGLLAASVAIMTGKYAVLATRLLALFLFLTAFTVHLPDFMGGNQAAMSQVLKDTALAGAALVLSGVFTPDVETGTTTEI